MIVTFNSLIFHSGHIRWLLLVITYVTITLAACCKKKKYYIFPFWWPNCNNFLLLDVVDSFCQTHNNSSLFSCDVDFWIKLISLVFLTKVDWCSIFYSCFMPFPIKTNERKLMNVHVQIKCYIMCLITKRQTNQTKSLLNLKYDSKYIHFFIIYIYN